MKQTELSLHKEWWTHELSEIICQKFRFKGHVYHYCSRIFLTLLLNIVVSCVSGHDRSRILPFWLILD